jgi:hypothetical protein
MKILILFICWCILFVPALKKAMGKEDEEKG